MNDDQVRKLMAQHFSEDQIRDSFQRLVQGGQVRVTDIKGGEPRFAITDEGARVAECVIAEMYGIPVDVFRSAPVSVQKQLTYLATILVLES